MTLFFSPGCHCRGRCLALFFSFSTLFHVVHAWDFFATEHGECGPLTVTWSGGQGPYFVTIHTLLSSATVVDVPDTAFTNGQGSMEITLQSPVDSQFIVSMGDSKGPLTGGTSPVLTTSARRDGTADCNPGLQRPDFFWSANAGDNVRQCQTYPFTEIGTATSTISSFQRPTVLKVLIPNGHQSFTVKMPNAPSFAWVADIKEGEQVVFDMVDDAGNQGGVGTLYTVQAGDSSCSLHQGTDASTSVANPSATATSSTDDEDSSSGGSLPQGALIGVIVGGLAVLGLLGIIVFLLLRRRQREKKMQQYADKPINLLAYPDGMEYSDDYDAQGGYSGPNTFRTSHYDVARHSEALFNPLITPSVHTPSTSVSSSNRHTAYSQGGALSPSLYPSPYGQQHASTPNTAKRASQPPQVIQHADIADTADQDDLASPPIELPPQYSESRAPLAQLAYSSVPARNVHGSHAPSASSSTVPSLDGSSRIGRSNSTRKGPR